MAAPVFSGSDAETASQASLAAAAILAIACGTTAPAPEAAATPAHAQSATPTADNAAGRIGVILGIDLPVAVVGAQDVAQQAAFVAQRVLELRDEGFPLNEISVLYRAHHHSMEIQVELTRRGIPFRVRSGLRFFEQAHIKDVLSYLRFVFNPLDELAFKRAVKLHEGIGNKSAEQLFTDLRDQLARGVDLEPPVALERVAFRAGSRGRAGRPG